MSPSDRSTAVRRLAVALGFDGVGITSADTLDPAPVQEWLARGHAAGMSWLSTSRCDPSRVLAGARSIISVALSYHHPGPRTARGPADGPHGVVARYARGRDYHDVLKLRLQALAARLKARFPEARYRAAVDTAPLLEKALAVRAGLGWMGKNTLLIRPPHGSWIVLGELLTDLELAPDDTEVPDRCGACVRCLEACPTGALVAPYRLDARRCIAYLTIENRGSIPRELRPQVGDRVFGCDACQEACPWNGRARRCRAPDLRPRAGLAHPRLSELLTLDVAGFESRFGGTPVARTGRGGLLRSACVALGNGGDLRQAGRLAGALSDAESLVRGHAAWALGRLGGAVARRALVAAARGERDPDATDEIRRARAGAS
jgi:epoxyqueuosine reductase